MIINKNKWFFDKIQWTDFCPILTFSFLGLEPIALSKSGAILFTRSTKNDYRFWKGTDNEFFDVFLHSLLPKIPYDHYPEECLRGLHQIPQFAAIGEKGPIDALKIIFMEIGILSI
jgi:hypothetical protein